MLPFIDRWVWNDGAIAYVVLFCVFCTLAVVNLWRVYAQVYKHEGLTRGGGFLPRSLSAWVDLGCVCFEFFQLWSFAFIPTACLYPEWLARTVSILGGNSIFGSQFFPSAVHQWDWESVYIFNPLLLYWSLQAVLLFYFLLVTIVGWIMTSRHKPYGGEGAVNVSWFLRPSFVMQMRRPFFQDVRSEDAPPLALIAYNFRLNGGISMAQDRWYYVSTAYTRLRLLHEDVLSKAVGCGADGWNWRHIAVTPRSIQIDFVWFVVGVYSLSVVICHAVVDFSDRWIAALYIAGVGLIGIGWYNSRRFLLPSLPAPFRIGVQEMPIIMASVSRLLILPQFQLILRIMQCSRNVFTTPGYLEKVPTLLCYDKWHGVIALVAIFTTFTYAKTVFLSILHFRLPATQFRWHPLWLMIDFMHKILLAILAFYVIDYPQATSCLFFIFIVVRFFGNVIAAPCNSNGMNHLISALLFMIMWFHILTLACTFSYWPDTGANYGYYCFISIAVAGLGAAVSFSVFNIIWKNRIVGEPEPPPNPANEDPTLHYLEVEDNRAVPHLGYGYTVTVHSKPRRQKTSLEPTGWNATKWNLDLFRDYLYVLGMVQDEEAGYEEEHKSTTSSKKESSSEEEPEPKGPSEGELLLRYKKETDHKLKALEHENRKLQKKIAALEAELAEHTNCTEEIIDLKESLKELKRENERLKEALAKRPSGSNEVDLQNLRDQLKDTRAHFERIKNAYEALEKENQELGAENERLRRLLTEANELNDTLRDAAALAAQPQTQYVVVQSPPPPRPRGDESSSTDIAVSDDDPEVVREAKRTYAAWRSRHPSSHPHRHPHPGGLHSPLQSPRTRGSPHASPRYSNSEIAWTTPS